MATSLQNRKQSTILVDELQKEALQSLKQFDQAQTIQKTIPKGQAAQNSESVLSSSSSSEFGRKIEPLFFVKEGQFDDFSKNRNRNGGGPLFSTCAGRQLSTLSREKKSREELLRNFMPYSSRELRLFTSNNLVGPPTVRVKVRPPPSRIADGDEQTEQTDEQKEGTINGVDEEEEEDDSIKFYATVFRSYREDRTRAREEISRLTSSNERIREEERRKIEIELEELQKREEGITDTKKQQLLEIIHYKQILNYDSAGNTDRIRLGAQCGLRSSVELSTSASSFSLEEEESNSKTLLLKNIEKKENINIYFYVTSLVLYRMGMNNLKNEPVVEYRWKLCLENIDPDAEDEKKYRVPSSSTKLSNIYQGVRVVSLSSRTDFVYLNVVRDLPISVPILNVPPTLRQQANQLNDLYLQFFYFKATTEKHIRKLLKLLHKTSKARGLTGEIDALTACQLEMFGPDGKVSENARKKQLQCLRDTISRSPWINKISKINQMRTKENKTSIWGGVGNLQNSEEVILPGTNFVLRLEDGSPSSFYSRPNLNIYERVLNRPPTNLGREKKSEKSLIEPEIKANKDDEDFLKILNSWIDELERLLIWIFPSIDSQMYMVLQLEKALFFDVTQKFKDNQTWLRKFKEPVDFKKIDLIIYAFKSHWEYLQLEIKEKIEENTKNPTALLSLILYEKNAIFATRKMQGEYLIELQTNTNSQNELHQMFWKVLTFMNSITTGGYVGINVEPEDIIVNLKEKPQTGANDTKFLENLSTFDKDQPKFEEHEDSNLRKRCRVLIEVCKFRKERKINSFILAEKEICFIFLNTMLEKKVSSKWGILLTFLELNYNLRTNTKDLKLLKEVDQNYFGPKLETESESRIQAFQLILDLVFTFMNSQDGWLKSSTPFLLALYQNFLNYLSIGDVKKGEQFSYPEWNVDNPRLKKWNDFPFQELADIKKRAIKNTRASKNMLCERYKKQFHTVCSELQKKEKKGKKGNKGKKELLQKLLNAQNQLFTTVKIEDKSNFGLNDHGNLDSFKLYLFQVVEDNGIVSENTANLSNIVDFLMAVMKNILLIK